MKIFPRCLPHCARREEEDKDGIRGELRRRYMTQIYQLRKSALSSFLWVQPTRSYTDHLRRNNPDRRTTGYSTHTCISHTYYSLHV